MNHSDSDDRTSTTSASSQGYNVPSTLAPNQRDLRKQAAVRNAAAAEAALKTDEEAEEKQAEKLKRGHSSLPPLDTSSTSYAGKEGAQTASKTASDAIFAQLEVIQTLQDEITREHAKLESLHEDEEGAPLGGNGDDEPLQSPDSPPTESQNSKTSHRQSSTNKPKPDEKHKRSRGASAKERSAAHAYDELAAGFQERAKGVDAIMEKMSRLSQAVKEFHSLPPPVLFPDSRMLGSGDVVDTPIAMTPAMQHRAA